MKQIQRNALNVKNNRKTSLIVLYSQNYAAGIHEHYHESSDCFEYPKIACVAGVGGRGRKRGRKREGKG